MSRTEEDIESGVDISIMRNATLRTYPASYSEVCDTFRPRLAGAKRTDSGRERFIHFLIPSPVRDLDVRARLRARNARIFGGMHFHHSVKEGNRLGRMVTEYVLKTHFLDRDEHKED